MIINLYNIFFFFFKGEKIFNVISYHFNFALTLVLRYAHMPLHLYHCALQSFTVWTPTNLTKLSSVYTTKVAHAACVCQSNQSLHPLAASKRKKRNWIQDTVRCVVLPAIWSKFHSGESITSLITGMPRLVGEHKRCIRNYSKILTDELAIAGASLCIIAGLVQGTAERVAQWASPFWSDTCPGQGLLSRTSQMTVSLSHWVQCTEWYK